MTPARFPHSDTPGSTLGCQLPRAYRRLLRPSSALDAKASTTCPSQLVTTHHHTNPHRNPHRNPHGNPHGPARRRLTTRHKETTHPHHNHSESMHNTTNTTNKTTSSQPPHTPSPGNRHQGNNQATTG